MYKIYLLFISSLLLASCATITTRKKYPLKLYSYEQNIKAKVYDSIYNLPATVMVKRSKEDLIIKLQNDTVSKTFNIKSSPSPAFLYGNLGFVFFAPVGYIVDFNTQKRFYYGRKILLNTYSKDSLIRPRATKIFTDYFSNYPTTHKGQINLTLSLPWGNGYHLQPHNEPSKNYGGFFGVSLGAEYYYKDNRFLALRGMLTDDFSFPIPVPIDNDDAYQSANALLINLTNNYKFGRFNLGYGLNYSVYTWRLINSNYRFPNNALNDYIDPDELRPPLKKNSHGVGFSFNAYHYISDGFYVGIIYSPTIYNTFPHTEFRYQHVYSLDFAYKFRLKKGKQ